MVKETKTTDGIDIQTGTTTIPEYKSDNEERRLIEVNIKELSTSELYAYEKLCEFVIDKIVNEIRMENQHFSTMYMYDSNAYGNYTESEKEKEFMIYSKIHIKIMEEIKRRLLLLK